MEIHTRCTPWEELDSYLTSIRPRKSAREIIYIFLVALVFVFGISCYQGFGLSIFGPDLIRLSPLFIGFGLFMTVMIGFHLLLPAVQKKETYFKITDDTIHWRLAPFDKKLSLKDLRKWKKGRLTISLYPEQGQRFYIPKRCLSPEEEKHLTGLLKRSIGPSQ